MSTKTVQCMYKLFLSYISAAQYQSTLPFIMIYKHDDDITPRLRYGGPLTLESLQQFVTDNKLPRLVSK